MSSNDSEDGGNYTYVPTAKDDALRPRGRYRVQCGTDGDEEVLGIVVNLKW